jgi:hypothetical protein
MGPDALATNENEYGDAKQENRTQHPRKMKMRPDALRTAKNVSVGENMKTGAEAVGTGENEYGDAKHENGARRPLNRRKRIRERKR